MKRERKNGEKGERKKEDRLSKYKNTERRKRKRERERGRERDPPLRRKQQKSEMPTLNASFSLESGGFVHLSFFAFCFFSFWFLQKKKKNG